MADVRARAGEGHDLSAQTGRLGQLERIGRAHVAGDRDDRALLPHHDGVAVAEIDLRGEAFLKEVVDVGFGDGLALSDHPDAAVAAAFRIDAPGALQIADDGVIRPAGVGPGTFDRTRHQHLDAGGGHGRGIDLNACGIDFPAGALDHPRRVAGGDTGQAYRSDPRHQDIALTVDGQLLIIVDQAVEGDPDPIAGLQHIAGVDDGVVGVVRRGQEQLRAQRRRTNAPGLVANQRLGTQNGSLRRRRLDRRGIALGLRPGHGPHEQDGSDDERRDGETRL